MGDCCVVIPAGIRVRTERLTSADLRSLWWAAPPLAVLVLANSMFELVGGAYAERAFATVTVGAGAPPDAAAIAAGFAWSATAMVYLVVGLGTAAAMLRIVRSRVRGVAVRPFRRFALAVIAIGLVHLLIVDGFGLPLGGIFHVTMTGLEASGLVMPWRQSAIALVVGAINVMSVAVPALIVTAAAASALPPLGGWDEASLVRRVRQVKRGVGVAAAFMVAGVLHMGGWTHWAGALTGMADLDTLATAVTLYWGTAFTLMIASFYLPVASELRRLAEEEMHRQEIDTGAQARWLADRDLSFAVNNQLPQIAAMAAPFLAGPLSEALRAAVGPFAM